MEVRNCKMCGRLFNVLNNERICPACQKKLEDKFHEVKQYLEDHPGASVEQTATDNDISTKQIRQWVKEERLILSSATEAGIVCENVANRSARDAFVINARKIWRMHFKMHIRRKRSQRNRILYQAGIGIA